MRSGRSWPAAGGAHRAASRRGDARKFMRVTSVSGTRAWRKARATVEIGVAAGCGPGPRAGTAGDQAETREDQPPAPPRQDGSADRSSRYRFVAPARPGATVPRRVPVVARAGLRHSSAPKVSGAGESTLASRRLSRTPRAGPRSLLAHRLELARIAQHLVHLAQVQLLGEDHPARVFLEV